MFHCVKVANPARLVALSLSGGSDAKRRWGDDNSPPNGVQGQRPWHAFGSFRRETKGTPGVGRVGPPIGRSEEPSLTTCSRRGCAPPRIGGCWGSRLLQNPRGEPQSPSTYTPKRTKSCTPPCNRTGRKIKKTGGPPRLFGGEPLCMLRLTTHQHVPSNATCDPGKIIVPQLLKIARKSVIITKLDCIH